MFAIMFGILGAFFLDNWYQERIDYKIRQDYLIRLQEDLKLDRDELMGLQEAHETRTLKATRMLPYFDKSEIHPDTFNNLYWFLFYDKDFIENDNTFRDLINTGRLELFSQNELKEKLLDLYAIYLRLNAKELHIRIDNKDFIYNPTSIVDMEALTKGVDFQSNFQKINSDRRIKNGFLLYTVNAYALSNLYHSGMDKLRELDSLIVSELEKY
jgi:hypothetical protein